VIAFQGVTKIYGDKGKALEGVTFAVRRGEFVYITGASGAGKTTLLRHIYMADRPTEGEVEVANFSSRTIARRDVPRLRRKLGVVFQDFRLLVDRSIFDNVAIVLRISGVSGKEIGKRVVKALAAVGLTHRLDELPGVLSGGEKQRLAIARAIVNDPYVLLADEPTGNLDPATSADIFAIFDRVNAGGTAVLVATHDVARATSGARRRMRLERGRLVEDTGAAAPAAAASGTRSGSVTITPPPAGGAGAPRVD
jgi:cell division transport system ATP-binding protein